MSNGVVRIVLEVQGARQLRDALRGTVRAARGADREIGASGRAAERARTQAVRQGAQEARRADQDRTRSARTAEQEKVRATRTAERARVSVLRETSREATRLQRVQAREMRQGMRAQRTGLANARRYGAGAWAVAGVAANRSTSYASELGMPNRGSMIQSHMSNQMDLIRLVNQAGRRDRMSDITQRVGQVAQTTLTDPSQVIQALGTAQNRFSDFDFFFERIEDLASASTATGASLDDMVGAVGEFRRQMGVTADEVPELIGAIVQSAREGSIEVGDISGSFASMIGSYQRLTGRGGVAGARDFLGVSQVLGAGGRDSSQTATLMENLMAKLGNSEVQQNLERTLGNREIFDRQGTMQVSMADLVGQLTDRNLSSSQLQGVFGRDMQANQAVGILTGTVRSQRANGVQNEVARIAESSSTQGNQIVAQTMGDIRSSATGGVMGRSIQSQVSFMQTGDDTIRTMQSIAQVSQDLNDRFPLLGDAVSDATSAFRAFSGAIATDNLAFGGGGAGGGAAGAAAGSMAGRGGMLGGIAGVAAAGLGGYAIGTWLNNKLGLSDSLERGVSGIAGNGVAASERTNVRGLGSSATARQPTVALSASATTAIGQAVGYAIANQAPGSGRQSGEPGRRM